jgi:hypothetical protein
MAKYYVFPLQPDGKTVLMSVKPAENPWTGTAAFLANLANPIGGNDDGRNALNTVNAEALEETRGKITINNITLPAFHVEYSGYGNMYFHLSPHPGFTYNAHAVLSFTDSRNIAWANREWRGEWSNPHNRGRNYHDYTHRNKRGLTLLENTGEVATLDLTRVDVTTNQTTATTIHANTQGVAHLAPNGNAYIGTGTLDAIRKLACWVQIRVLFATTRDQAILARQRALAINRFARAHRLDTSAATMRTAFEAMQLATLAVPPPAASTIPHLCADLVDLQACLTAFRNYSPDNPIAGIPGPNVNRLPAIATIVKFAEELAPFVNAQRESRDDMVRNAYSNGTGIGQAHRHRFDRF